MYENGTGIPEDHQKASKLYFEAADSGLPFAQLYCGLEFVTGVNVERDPAKAAHYYLKAADQGLTIAEVLIGMIFKSGIGVKVNKEKSVEYLKKAARKQHPTALYLVGDMYYQGEILIVDDHEKALRYVPYYEHLNSYAHLQIGDSKKEKEIMHQNLLYAFDCFQLAAKYGDYDAMKKISLMLRYGEGVPKNKKEADKWLRLALEKIRSSIIAKRR
jgi:TPR repeat protein